MHFILSITYHARIVLNAWGRPVDSNMWGVLTDK